MQSSSKNSKHSTTNTTNTTEVNRTASNPEPNYDSHPLVFTHSDTAAVLKDIERLLPTLAVNCDEEDATQVHQPDFRHRRLCEALRDRLSEYVESGADLVEAA